MYSLSRKQANECSLRPTGTDVNYSIDTNRYCFYFLIARIWYAINMKYLKHIPYIRLWANIFEFHGKETINEYVIDFILWLFITSGLIVGFYFLYTISDIYFRLLIYLAIYLLLRFPLISATSRRFQTIGTKPGFCYFMFIPMGVFWSILVCLFARSEEESNKKSRFRRVRVPIISSTVLSGSVVVVPFVVWVVVTIVLDLFAPPSTAESSFDINKYDYYREKIKYAEKMLPSLDEVGNPINKEFAYRCVVYNRFIGFVSDGISLFLDYDENDYDSEKETILNSYTFLDSPKKDSTGYWQFPVSSFGYSGYSFKIVPKDEYSCKSFTMIGFDEENNSIAYLYFHDFDIDYLEDGNATEEEKNKRMPRLIETAFYWRQSFSN